MKTRRSDFLTDLNIYVMIVIYAAIVILIPIYVHAEAPHVWPLPPGSSRVKCALAYAPGAYLWLDPMGAIFNQNEIEKSLAEATQMNLNLTHAISTKVSDSDKNITIFLKVTMAPLCTLRPDVGCHSLMDGGPAYECVLFIVENATGNSATIDKVVRGTYRVSKIPDITLKLDHPVRFAETGSEVFHSVGTHCVISED